MKKSIIILLLVLVLLINGCQINENQSETSPDTPQYEVHTLLREGTEDETEAYYYNSGQDGSRIFIIGGTHGNETAGFLAAEKLMEFFPNYGEILIIPKANKRAIEANGRTSENNIDLNRSYTGEKDGNDVELLANEIFNTIKNFNPDVVIDLHESLDFYTEGRLGNSIILGIEGEHLLKVITLLEYINEAKLDEVEFTYFGNPPLNSLNESVSKHLNIPVFTIETTRVNTIEKRIEQQLLISKKIIELYDKR